MKSGIYKITNEITGKFYIGSAKDIDWRWFEHKRDLRLQSHCNPKLQHSWNFYGADKFTFIILEEVEPDQQKLFEREQYYLDVFKPWMRGVGYNICPTAQGGDNITHHPHRKAFIEKMSKICSGEGNAMFGRTHRKESIVKQKVKAKGRFTLEWFVEKYGREEGSKKYNERRLMLSKRPSHSHKAWNKGKKMKKWKQKDGWLEQRNKTKKYLETHYDDFRSLILSKKYSQREICRMTGMSREAVRKHCCKIKNPEGEHPSGL